MSMPADPVESGDFFAVAARQSLLSEQLSQELAAESRSRGIAPARLALERGALTPVQIEIVETLLQAGDAVPGYEILDVLGCGGMGVVYKARQKNLDRVVALKTVLVSQIGHATVLARFEQEAHTVAQLRHPNIVVAYDFGRHQGRLYLAMELIDGEDLGVLIERQGRLDERFAWGLARQAAAGLAQAARLGVVHRDVKPGNMLLVAPPEGYQLPAGLPMLKLTDFGLALITSEQEVDERLTMAGSALGTPRYMAPEQFQGSDVDARADIYALGATVYHMLAGSPPFAEKTLPQILARKLNGRAEPLDHVAPGTSAATCTLVDAMMAADRTRRVQTYGELFGRIDQILADAALPASASAHALPVAATRAFGSLDDTTVLTAAPTPTMLAPAVDLRNSRWTRRTWLFLPAAALACCAAGWWFLRHRETVRRVVLLSPGEWGQFLYDGESLRGWLPLGGEWSHGRDAEGGHVLRGKGTIRRVWSRDPPVVNYRLNLAADLQTATAVELHFALAANAGNQPPRLVLRMAPSGVVLGSRNSDRDPLVARGPALPLPPSDEDSPTYHELRVERHATHWLAFFDNQAVGTMPAREHELPQFLLVAENGTALFAEVQLTEMVMRE